MRPHLRSAVRVAQISSNLRSYRVLRRLMASKPDVAGQPLEHVRLRPLGGRTVWLRPGTSDAQVVWDTFVGRYHLPPAGQDDHAVTVILDLGSNIGLTMAHMAHLYPDARIVGVEMDPGNAALAHLNTRYWQDRCEIVQAAIWTNDGHVRYEGAAGDEYGFHIVNSSGSRLTPALSLSSLVARAPAGIIYVKMDIEGSERCVLQSGGGWSAGVDKIKVEVHPPYTLEECASDLSQLGFQVFKDPRHWACAVGIRVSASRDSRPLEGCD